MMPTQIEWLKFERANRSIRYGASISDACREEGRTKKWWTEMHQKFIAQLPAETVTQSEPLKSVPQHP